jgi:CHASE3 domain sensor protein
MKELTHSVRAHLLAGYVTALLLLGVTAIGAVTATGAVSHGFIQAVQTDGPLMQDVLRRVALMVDEETGLRGYLLTHDASFLVPIYDGATHPAGLARARCAPR